LVTVPNEKGLVFLVKWLAKKWMTSDTESYTVLEFVNAVLGRMHRVARKEHKGFDYAELIKRIQRHFDVIKICGIPYSILPPYLNFGIGIVARSQRSVSSVPLSLKS
jgi:hypothetical protein